jgi:thiol-disulfide isomerase/thioredoxin
MHTSFRSVAALVSTFALLLAPSIALAADPRPFDPSAFKAAQAAGKPIVVEIHADWCTECKMQNRVLNKLSDQPPYANLVRLRVDYDKQKDVVKEFKAKKQSTLVVYKGDKELARAVGITSEDKIRALVDKAI